MPSARHASRHDANGGDADEGLPAASWRRGSGADRLRPRIARPENSASKSWITSNARGSPGRGTGQARSGPRAVTAGQPRRTQNLTGLLNSVQTELADTGDRTAA